MRDMLAESVGERVKDVKRTVEVLIDLGSGPGLVRRYLDAEKLGLKKVVLCDSCEEALYRDAHLDSSFPCELSRNFLLPNVEPTNTTSCLSLLSTSKSRQSGYCSTMRIRHYPRIYHHTCSPAVRTWC